MGVNKSDANRLTSISGTKQNQLRIFRDLETTRSVGQIRSEVNELSELVNEALKAAESSRGCLEGWGV